MNLDIALLLAQDGLTNGAIYALLALALVLVFAVTRVIYIPQGEFVAYGALFGSLPDMNWAGSYRLRTHCSFSSRDLRSIDVSTRMLGEAFTTMRIGVALAMVTSVMA